MEFLRSTFISAVFAAAVSPAFSFAAVDFDLRGAADESRLLENPDKGLYHHYYDNSLNYYLGDEADIERIPCLHHLFLRFAWSFLEPKEGEFNWKLIDEQVERWHKRGVKISLSITAQETGLVYATPKWVFDAGAKGAMYKVRWGGREVFEPDFGDPIFLEKLENLQKAIAARYDGKPYIVDVTIASIGNWGEGHLSATSKLRVPPEITKKHIDIYRRSFKKTRIVIGDDYLAWKMTPAETVDLRRYVKERKIAYRDDSILVNKPTPKGRLVLHPEFFDDSAPYAPATLENGHYGHMKRDKCWIGRNGEKVGCAEMFRIVERTQCTFLGFHGNAREFLSENPDYACRIANKVGYWFFVDKVSLDLKSDSVKILWRNNGAARAYKKYAVEARVCRGGKTEFSAPLANCDVRTLAPATQTETSDAFPFSKLPQGDYDFQIRVKAADGRFVKLGFGQWRETSDGFYRIGKFAIK